MASAHVAAKVHIMHVGLRAADFLSVIAIVGHVFGSVVRAHRVVAQLLDPVLVGNSALDGALLTAIVAATATRSPPIPVAACTKPRVKTLGLANLGVSDFVTRLIGGLFFLADTIATHLEVVMVAIIFFLNPVGQKFVIRHAAENMSADVNGSDSQYCQKRQISEHGRCNFWMMA